MSTATTAYNCTVAAVQTITDDEIKEAWLERKERIKEAQEQFSLTVQDVFKEKYEKIIKSKKSSKAKRKRLAKSAA